MSGISGTTTSSQLAAAEQAATANSLSASTASTASSSAASDASATAATDTATIAGNFNSFLTLLTTQLQNQDPSSPMDSDTFTSEIATFAGVQQSVNTNTNLGTLISLNQDSQLTSDAGLVGQTATFTATQIPLQSGTANIGFTTATAEPIAIAVTNAAGTVVRTVQETSTAGANTWQWDGKDDAGNTLADGAYGVSVQSVDSGGTAVTVPFTGTGTVTGISKSSTGVVLQMGAQSVDMTDVSSVVAPAATTGTTTTAAASPTS